MDRRLVNCIKTYTHPSFKTTRTETLKRVPLAWVGKRTFRLGTQPLFPLGRKGTYFEHTPLVRRIGSPLIPCSALFWLSNLGSLLSGYRSHSELAHRFTSCCYSNGTIRFSWTTIEANASTHASILLFAFLSRRSKEDRHPGHFKYWLPFFGGWFLCLRRQQPLLRKLAILVK